jgi:hypothetical protein
VSPDIDVVRYVGSVVELRALIDTGITERATIDAGARANFDVIGNDHAATLGEPPELAELVTFEAEAVGTENGAGLYHYASADAYASSNDGACPNAAVASNLGSFLHHREGGN